MRKITKMGETGALEEVFLCDRVPCTNTFTEHHLRIAVGMWNLDLCPECRASLREWLGEWAWDLHADYVPGQLSAPPLKEQVPDGVKYLTAAIDLLLRLDHERAKAERKLDRMEE